MDRRDSSKYKKLARIALAFVLLLIFSSSIYAQHSFFSVNELHISGNNKTKQKTILRELNFKQGDKIISSSLNARLEENKLNLFNTGLFNHVSITAVDSTGTIKIALEERWFWFAIPVFELADRNFNVWWTEQDRDWERTKYGFNLLRYNMRGRNETLSTGIRWGYNRKLILDYEFPFIDKKKILGLIFSSHYYADRELGIRTTDNKWEFNRSNSFNNSRFHFGFSISRRKKLNSTHYLQLFYQHNTINDSIQLIAPDYFSTESNTQRFVRAAYVFEHDERDVKKYPTKGYYLRAKLDKRGLGLFNDVDLLFGEIHGSLYQPISDALIVSASAKYRRTLSGNSSYNQENRLGFLETQVRGYEYYIVEAPHFLLGKLNFRQVILKREWRNPLSTKDQFRRIPIAIYFKLHQEIAWTQGRADPLNPLNDSFLSGTGIGLELFTWYDMQMSIDYSWNHRGENGLYLHFNTTWDYWKIR
ncbi:BamA/TamA family outer membrane protein [Chitinophagales bacterium]|nr:BamA/TamA family outer membrane protein [Chitinophagales bacterium]